MIGILTDVDSYVNIKVPSSAILYYNSAGW